MSALAYTEEALHRAATAAALDAATAAHRDVFAKTYDQTLRDLRDVRDLAAAGEAPILLKEAFYRYKHLGFSRRHFDRWAKLFGFQRGKRWFVLEPKLVLVLREKGYPI